jgi:hypothetical protein
MTEEAKNWEHWEIERLKTKNKELLWLVDVMLLRIDGKCSVYKEHEMDACLWVYDGTKVNGQHLHYMRDGDCCLWCRFCQHVYRIASGSVPRFHPSYCSC